VNSAAVYVDDVSSWPLQLREHTDTWLRRLRETPPGPNGPEIGWEADEPVLALLGGRPLRTYHCTCLLDHEAAHIRDRGLRPLSRELVEERIDEARAAGIISADEADLLHRSHVYCGRDHASRSGQVWLFAGQAVLAKPTNLRTLLTTWGGEAMYMERMEPRAVLKRLGRPAIVAVDLDLALIDPKHLMGRLMAAFVDARRCTPTSATVQVRDAVPAAAIVDIWHPGHPSYDAHIQLPH
jgi:hypothetical protein